MALRVRIPRGTCSLFRCLEKRIKHSEMAPCIRWIDRARTDTVRIKKEEAYQDSQNSQTSILRTCDETSPTFCNSSSKGKLMCRPGAMATPYFAA
ncbi:unnamed protein product [Acanthoscelides obtectus]|uniref:Uncharacterized protein n=1 Tax=Acanthoscelides obtectus TaxID=200917 RepID=A0A9P0JJW9_ACAOB|nr:unnamed protein product [Acanthoscelides obtectus]CAK1654322.1 hypothetical protein AOBTE_LOCUS18523 [Acanthoscelides obtectus]